MDETQKIFDTYEKIAEQYAVFTKFKPNNVHLERPAIRALVPDIQGAHVLDAGCGPGTNIPWLIERGAQMLGIEINELISDAIMGMRKVAPEIGLG